MYKITLLDNCTPSFISMPAEYFTTNIHQIQNYWQETGYIYFSNLLERSINGENIIVDLINLPLLQEDKNTKILFKKDLIIKDKVWELVNEYEYITQLWFNNLLINILWIKFDEIYYRIASFEFKGLAKLSKLQNKTIYNRVQCYGNPIIKDESLFVDNNIYHSHEPFMKNKLSSICYIPLEQFNNETDVKLNFENYIFTDKDFKEMTRDILGECG